MTALTPSEKALFTARRKEAYEALHPETRNGENQHSRVRQVGEGTAADRFTADTASKTGESERTIQRNAERGEKGAPRPKGVAIMAIPSDKIGSRLSSPVP